ncbi:MAG: serine hydrolase [Lewinella sp.]|nr:serine hydrolase [Lewinella sp.]
MQKVTYFRLCLPIWVTLSVICIFLQPSFAQQDTQELAKRLEGIETELNAVLDSFQTPGFAVSVVSKDRILYARGFGYRDYENKIPADANTLYAIGSCTKAFTSSVLGQLREEGKIVFDEAPRKYLPELIFFNDEMNNGITVKDLMCHMTGLPRHDLSWYLNPTDSKKELIKRVAYQEPFTGVRQSWYYNNFMFLAQGLIAEELTGKSWEQNVADRFFKPLGMSRSNLSIDGLKQSDNAALGYELTNEGEISKLDYYHIAGMSPAGSINSSVNEMANWVITWINGGIFKGDTLLPAGYIREAMSAQSIVNAGLPEAKHPDLHFSSYGYGWFTSSYKGHYRVQHGGNIDGFSANTCFFPSDSIGIVVLTNQNGSAVPSVVRNIVSDRILGVERSDWTAELMSNLRAGRKAQKEGLANRAANRKTGAKPSHLLPEYAGEYNHPGYGTFEVIVKNDSLFAKFPIKTFWLKHYHYDVFQPLEATPSGIDTSDLAPGFDLNMNFKANNTGEISSLSLKAEPMLDPIEFKRSPKAVDLAPEALKAYVGAYELSGLTTEIYLKKEDTLYLKVPGQPEYELLPTGEDRFAIKVLDGYNLQFKKDDQEKITSVLFMQPNGTFEAKRK